MKKTVLLFVLLFAVSGFANDFYHINTEPYWDDNVTGGWIGQAQTFQAPTNADTLVSWEFELAGRTSPGQITFGIYQWGASGPVGNPLYSQNLTWGTQAQVFDVDSINLALTPGQLYGADIDLQGYNGNSVYFMFNQQGYPGYNDWFYNPDFGGWNNADGTNQYFQAYFQYAPEPSSFILLGSSVLLGFGALRRRF